MFKNATLILSQEDAMALPASGVTEPSVADGVVPAAETPGVAANVEPTVLEVPVGAVSDNVTAGEAVAGVIDSANALTESQAEAQELLNAAQSLEEIADYLVERLDSAEGTLTPQEVIDAHSRVAVLSPRTSEGPVTLLIPSIEAFELSPKVALEGAVDFVMDAIRKIWAQIVKAIKATIEAVKKFWAALLVFFKFREAKNEANSEAIKKLDSMPTSVRKMVQESELTIKGRHVRNLWMAGTNDISKDPARDMRELNDAYSHVHKAHQDALMGWGVEIADSLKKAASEARSVKDRNDLKGTIGQWEANFNAIVTKHEGQITAVTNRYKGTYIGCIEIRDATDPYQLLETRVPTEAAFDMPTPQYLKNMNDEFKELHKTYQRLYHEYTPAISSIEKTVADIYAIIGSDMLAGVVSRNFVGTFDKNLRKFTTAFNRSQGQNSRVVKRILDIGGTIDTIVKDVTAIYDDVVKENEGH